MSSDDHQIVICHECGAKNRIPSARLSSPSAKCGRCGAPIQSNNSQPNGVNEYKLRCKHCNTRNRVPATKLNQGPKCGKCGELLDTSDILSGSPIMVNDSNFQKKVIESPLPVLMYAWATWCSGCRTAGPIVDQFAAESIGKVRVAKLNVENSPSLSSRFNILSIPFLFIFDKGELKESMPGGLAKHDLMIKMARYV